MPNTVQLTVKLNADGTGLVADVNQVSRAFRQLDQRVQQTDRGTKTLGTSFRTLTPLVRSVGAALGGLSLGAGIFTGVRTLASFSQELSTLQAVTGATEQQFARLRAEAENLGATTRFSATQAAEGATFLARAGFDADEVLSSLGSTLLLAQAGALELGSAADIASNVLQGFRLEAEQTNRVVDVLALGANRTNTNVEQLGQAMSFAAPAAAAIGVSLEEASAAVGALSDAGIQAERAGTGLRQILIQLEAAGGELSVQANGLSGVLETLANRNISLSEATDLVGVRQASALLVLIDSARKVRELTAEYENAEGTARRVAETMDANLNGALLATRSAVEAVTLAMGNLGAESTLTGFFQGLSGVLRSTAENMDLVVDGATLVAVAIGARMVPAITASIAAQRVAIVESFRYQAALARMAGVSRGAAAAQVALGTAAGGASAVMAALGGPVGVAITAAAAVALFASNSETAGSNADTLSAKVDQLAASFGRLSERGQEAARAVLEATRAQAESEIEAIRSRLEAGGTVAGGRGNSFLPGGVLVPDSDEEIVEFERRLRVLQDTSAKARDELLKLAGIEEIVIDGFERVEGSINGADGQMKAATATAKELSAAKRRAAAAFRGLESAVRDGDRELAAYSESITELFDALFPLEAAQRQFNAELKILDRQLADGEITADRYAESLQRLKERHAELFPEVQRAKAAADELSRAWVEATNRIDEAFADAWKGAFDSFNDFASSLKDAFRNLLAEMAHFAITRPILVNLGLLGAGSAPGSLFNALQGGGGGIAGGSVGGSAGFLGLLGGLGGGLNQGLLTARSSILGGLNNLGFGGAANVFGRGTANLARAPGGLAGGLAFSALGGFAGGQLSELLGGQSGTISALGGLGGTLAGANIGALGALGGPIGAFVGSLIGGLADAAFGGDGKKRFVAGVATGSGTNRGNAFADVTAASGLRLRAVENRAGPEGRDAAQALLDTLLGLDQALVALSSAAGVDVDFSGRSLAGQSGQAGRSGVGDFFGVFGFNGDPAQGSDLEGAADRFVQSWLAEINDQLPQRVRQIIGGVDAVAQELVGAFEAAVSIDRLLGLDVVQRTEEALEELGQANRTLLERYGELTEAALGAAGELDGTTASLVSLNGVLGQQKLAAAELAAAYRVVGIESDQIIGNTIQGLRESLLSEQELYELRRQQIADLSEQLGTTTDPGELARIRDQVLGFTNSALGQLDDDQRREIVPGVIDFLQTFGEQFQAQVGTGLGDLGSRESGLLQGIELELNAMGSSAQGVSGQFGELSDQMGQFSERLNLTSEQVRRLQQTLAALQESGVGQLRV